MKSKDAMKTVIRLEGHFKLPKIELKSPGTMTFPHTFISESASIEIQVANKGNSRTNWALKGPNRKFIKLIAQLS